MSEEKRRILRHEFDLDKMLGMKPDEARQYFLLEFFPPFAYNAWETRNARYAILHIGRSLFSGSYFPLVSLANIAGNGGLLPPVPADAFRSDQEWNWDSHGMYERTFGVQPDRKKLSAALERAFAECFMKPKPVSLNELPLVATIRDLGNESYKLNILVKSKYSAPREGVLGSQTLCREDAMKLSGTYGRFYNALTGEWTGLCGPEDGPCPQCEALKKSRAGKNFYDDAGAT